MRLSFVEIANFRKLYSARISFTEETTVFVGANNSGKTSAMTALRFFLLPRSNCFSINDVSLSHWPVIDGLGRAWEEALAQNLPLPAPDLSAVMPYMDVWLTVEDREIHLVQKMLPTLDWTGGLIGMRLQLEPKDALELQTDYFARRQKVLDLQAKITEGEPVTLWPEGLRDYLARGIARDFAVRAYVLDAKKLVDPLDGLATPQALSANAEPIDGDPFDGLIRIDEISAQRGFGQSDSGASADDVAAIASIPAGRLADQLKRYYAKHLDPSEVPEIEDLEALRAIEAAQSSFGLRLREGFAPRVDEVQGLGYPGITDPTLIISARLKYIDSLNHSAAVQYVVRAVANGEGIDLQLPEDSVGLGYQNLISMVFRLMGFRDAWMRVGKAALAAPGQFTPPLHLVLVEEPEAHLHTQVQQVFIRKAYEVLRNHEDLGEPSEFRTQLIVSTHSSHIAHECEFESLRYFRRLPGGADCVPTSRVVNLESVFGNDNATRRFVTRYLKVTHCDLFFADAAVLVEGPVERMLIPFFLREQSEFKLLTERYITWLEIGGSHAHRLRPLIESLFLTTLVITDIDAMDGAGAKTCPRRSQGQETRNKTLKSWCPELRMIDELLEASTDDKVLDYGGQDFQVRAAYQNPQTVDFKGVQSEALSYTFEDALVLANLSVFEKAPKRGLLTKFRKAIEDSADVAELQESLFDALKTGDKAELAMDLLELEDKVVAPQYIADGLAWLIEQICRRQRDLDLSAAAAPSEAACSAVLGDEQS